MVVLLALLLVLVGVVVAGGTYYEWAVGASGAQKPIVVTIPHGATGSDVGGILKEQGVIRSTLAFRVLARFRGFSGGFQAGRYHLKTNMSVSDVLAALKEGPFLESIRATFAEGWSVDRVAQRAHDALGINAKQFVKAANSGSYSVDDLLPPGTKTVEGFLFPSTYDFFKGATADGVIRRLLSQFQVEAAKLPWDNAKALGLSKYQVVVVASMIEREAKLDPDRPKVAAVIYNRLKKGMALQIDATILYGLEREGRPLSQCGTPPAVCVTNADLKVESPYNTYIHPGLPPTPIDSPSFASLVAALTPAKADYLYYVSDSAGANHFASTYAEFLALKRKYLG